MSFIHFFGRCVVDFSIVSSKQMPLHLQTGKQVNARLLLLCKLERVHLVCLLKKHGAPFW